jgi:chemotaxis protein CheD
MTMFGDIAGHWAEPDEHTVLIVTGELAVGDHPQVLVTPALGSCVGVTLWDAFARRGGMAHVMLPSPADSRVQGAMDRFAAVAVPKLAELVAKNGHTGRLVAKIAGGAAMFGGGDDGTSIGARNIAEVKRQLALLRIPLVAEDTGGAHARTIELHLDTGLVIVRSYRYGIKDL